MKQTNTPTESREDWREGLRDLYLHSSPDEEGLITGSILMGGIKFALSQTQEKVDFYLANKDSLESFIENKITQAEDNMRKRCLEALPKERNLNTKFPTFGVNRENESWIRGFNVAIDQATQNIKELKKKT